MSTPGNQPPRFAPANKIPRPAAGDNFVVPAPRTSGTPGTHGAPSAPSAPGPGQTPAYPPNAAPAYPPATPPAYPPAYAPAPQHRPGRTGSPYESGSHGNAAGHNNGHINPARPGTPGADDNLRPPKKRRRWLRRVGLMLLAVVLLVAAWGFYLISTTNSLIKHVPALSTKAAGVGTAYLIAGSDSRQGAFGPDGTEGQRSDSIILLHVAENGQAAAISLPRDSYVPIPGYGSNKINAAYSFGGPSLLVQTVENLTGIKVDHYIEIGMGGVMNIVDAVGGVDLCMDQVVNDDFSGLYWPGGCVTCDGKTALAFSRMRYSDPRGDIGRAERQRQVLGQLVGKMASWDTVLNPAQTLRVARAGAQAVTTDPDTGVWALGKMALAYRSASKAGLTGAPPISNMDYRPGKVGSAVQLDPVKSPEFFAKLAAGTLTPADVGAK